jgi:antitoxin PrlF
MSMKASKLTSKYQATIPEEVREILELQKGDSVLFIIDEKGVQLRKAKASDLMYLQSVQSQMNEWSSDADNEAFADL